MVERLLKSDAEPGLTDHQGCTPCHLAAWHGDAEICLQLLNAGTEGLCETESEITPVQVNQQVGTIILTQFTLSIQNSTVLGKVLFFNKKY